LEFYVWFRLTEIIVVTLTSLGESQPNIRRYLSTFTYVLYEALSESTVTRDFRGTQNILECSRSLLPLINKKDGVKAIW
jgi:hypothetical protein